MIRPSICDQVCENSGCAPAVRSTLAGTTCHIPMRAEGPLPIMMHETPDRNPAARGRAPVAAATLLPPARHWYCQDADDAANPYCVACGLPVGNTAMHAPRPACR